MTGVDHLDYTQLQGSLDSADVGIGISEVHGIVCGAICNQIKSGREQDLSLLIASDAITEPRTLRLLQGPIKLVYQQSSAMLHQGDAEFSLLLPDDGHSLAERTEALASWCRGFLHGLLHNDAFDIEQLPGDAEEVARDFLAFSDAESGANPSEDDERAFVEIEEYIRVGVQLIVEELYAEHPNGRPAGGVH